MLRKARSYPANASWQPQSESSSRPSSSGRLGRTRVEKDIEPKALSESAILDKG